MTTKQALDKLKRVLRGYTKMPEERKAFAVLEAALKPWPKAIVVTVERGLVQDVDGIPPGTVIEVHDYDTDGNDGDRGRKDKDGRDFHLGSWVKE